MKVLDALKARRTVRIFRQDIVDREFLIKMIDMARLSPSAGNIQSLKYRIIDLDKERLAIFSYIKYAGYVPDWNPEFSETPSAFIAVLNDKNIRPTNALTECDSGIAMMAILLSAVELGFDSCVLGSIDRIKISEILKLGSNYDILYLIGVGKSNHKNLQFDCDDSVKYTMDVHHVFQVPKRKLETIIINS